MSSSPLMKTICLIALLIFVIVVAKLVKRTIERFDTSGALMQLSADHVPTVRRQPRNPSNSWDRELNREDSGYNPLPGWI